MTDPVVRLRAALADRYRLERELGQGGMATVYLAHDLKHDRKVAVKVLRPEVAAILGADRFLAEIKTTASLQHPNILALFDSGASDGFLYYVMPYLEGETLRDRLNRETQLDVETAVAITTEVAGALDYAHRHGIIHRDIKPENILLHDGRPVVADFGIALAVSAAAGGRMTETGLSLGTPHYMSPEQAAADKQLTGRTDVYSLGAVLYELLTGSPPHVGSSAQQVVSKIVTEDAAPVATVRKSVPPNVDAAVGKALERLPADRFATAKAFAEALLDPAFRTARSEPGAGRRGARWPIGAVGLAAGIVLGLLAGRTLVRPAPARSERFAVPLPDSAPLIAGAGVNLAWAPDGSRLVYVGPSPGGEAQLWQRAIDELQLAPISGTEGARIPVVSPNDSLVAFTAQDALKVVPLYGGPPTVLVPDRVPSAGGGLAWSDDGWIYFVGQAGGIERVAVGGGPRSVVVAADTAAGGYMWLEALPGGKALLFTIARVGIPEASVIAAVPTSGGPVRRLFTGVMARYVRPGYVVFATAEGTLMAAPFDARRLEVTGTASAVAQGIDVYMGSAAQFALSRAGDLAWVSHEVAHEVVRVDRRGVALPLDFTLAEDASFVALSPDGERLAVTTVNSAGSKVWIQPLRGGPPTPVPMSGTRNVAIAWSPDGQRIAVVSNQVSPGQLWLTRVDRLGAAERVPLQATVFTAAWAPDGSELVAATSSPGPTSAIVSLRLGGDSAVRPLVRGRFLLQFPALSPDGRWLAYTSNESGHDEVYVRPFRSAGDVRWQVSTAGGLEPTWAHSGRELFYRSASGNLTAVAVEADPSGGLRSGPPQALFPIGGFVDGREYAVTADDQHFIVVRPVRRVGSELMVVEHFDAELRRKLGR